MHADFFKQAFLNSLPSDNLEACLALCGEFDRFRSARPARPEHHDDYIETMAILRAFIEHRQTELGVAVPEPGHNMQENVNTAVDIWQTFRSLAKTAHDKRRSAGLLADKTEEYAAIFGKVPRYEFSETEFKRIQDLMNELRELIRESNLVTADHKRRLLRRLEAMQAELDRKTSDIDRFWGFIGEAGITVRRFGEDMKPISDRVTELGKIVIGVILAKEGIKALPEISKLLHLGQ